MKQKSKEKKRKGNHNRRALNVSSVLKPLKASKNKVISFNDNDCDDNENDD